MKSHRIMLHCSKLDAITVHGVFLLGRAYDLALPFDGLTLWQGLS